MTYYFYQFSKKKGQIILNLKLRDARTNKHTHTHKWRSLFLPIFEKNRSNYFKFKIRGRTHKHTHKWRSHKNH